MDECDSRLFCAVCTSVFLFPACRKKNAIARHHQQSRSFTFSCSSCVTKACRVARRHNRRANKKNIEGKIKPGDWLCALFAHKFMCAACKIPDRRKLTLDHIVPLSKGGKNVWENIQPLCEVCHFEKDRIIGRVF